MGRGPIGVWIPHSPSGRLLSCSGRCQEAGTAVYIYYTCIMMTTQRLVNRVFVYVHLCRRAIKSVNRGWVIQATSAKSDLTLRFIFVSFHSSISGKSCSFQSHWQNNTVLAMVQRYCPQNKQFLLCCILPQNAIMFHNTVYSHNTVFIILLGTLDS